jgi:hypothetical protein
MQNAAVQNLKGQLAIAEAKLSELSTVVGKNHPSRVQQEAQIAIDLLDGGIIPIPCQRLDQNTMNTLAQRVHPGGLAQPVPLGLGAICGRFGGLLVRKHARVGLAELDSVIHLAQFFAEALR